jgi:hypothetical protein
MTEPPSSRTRSSVLGRSATVKYGREAVSPGPGPRSWTPRRRLSVSACHPDPAAAGRGESATPRTPCQNRSARSGSSAGNSMSGAGIEQVWPAVRARFSLLRDARQGCRRRQAASPHRPFDGGRARRPCARIRRRRRGVSSGPPPVSALVRQFNGGRRQTEKGCRTGPLVYRHARALVGQQERVRWNGCGTKVVHRATSTSSSSGERRAFRARARGAARRDRAAPESS